jgi:hypothetical protein
MQSFGGSIVILIQRFFAIWGGQVSGVSETQEDSFYLLLSDLHVMYVYGTRGNVQLEWVFLFYYRGEYKRLIFYRTCLLQQTVLYKLKELKFCFGCSLLTCTSLALRRINSASGSCLMVVGGSVYLVGRSFVNSI